MLVFDREGYSPEFFSKLWSERVAFCSYKKNDKTKWDTALFNEYTIKTEPCQTITMKLAEKKVTLSNNFVVREIRKLSKTGHQTIILTTNFKDHITQLGNPYV